MRNLVLFHPLLDHLLLTSGSFFGIFSGVVSAPLPSHSPRTPCILFPSMCRPCLTDSRQQLHRLSNWNLVMDAQTFRCWWYAAKWNWMIQYDCLDRVDTDSLVEHATRHTYGYNPDSTSNRFKNTLQWAKVWPCSPTALIQCGGILLTMEHWPLGLCGVTIYTEVTSFNHWDLCKISDLITHTPITCILLLYRQTAWMNRSIQSSFKLNPGSFTQFIVYFQLL